MDYKSIVSQLCVQRKSFKHFYLGNVFACYTQDTHIYLSLSICDTYKFNPPARINTFHKHKNNIVGLHESFTNRLYMDVI